MAAATSAAIVMSMIMAPAGARPAMLVLVLMLVMTAAAGALMRMIMAPAGAGPAMLVLVLMLVMPSAGAARLLFMFLRMSVIMPAAALVLILHIHPSVLYTGFTFHHFME